MTPHQRLMQKFEDHWARQHPTPDLRFACEQAFLAGAVAAMEMHFEPRTDWFADHPQEADTPFIVTQEPRQSHQDCDYGANDHPAHELGGEG